MGSIITIGQWVFAGVVGLGSLWGGFAAIRGIWRWFRTDRSALELVNVDCLFYRNNRNQITGLHLSAILTNNGRDDVFVGVVDANASLAGKRYDPDPVHWPVLRVGPKIATALNANNITYSVPLGQFVEGRIDWLLRAGREEANLNRDFRIKGQIAVDNAHQPTRFLWLPDHDSERPVGMKNFAMEVPPGERKIAAAKSIKRLD